MAALNATSKLITLEPHGCSSVVKVICRKAKLAKPNCGDMQQIFNGTVFNVILNPKAKLYIKQVTGYIKSKMLRTLARLNHSEAFGSILETLWHSSLPCSDLYLRGDGLAVVKNCQWKGKPVPCSAIFKPFPTDQGMCCSFNVGAAEDIFSGEVYSKTLNKIQNRSQNVPSDDRDLPNWYTANNEPRMASGDNQGLVFYLDSHSDQVTRGSYDSAFDGFQVFIGTLGSFPLLGQKSTKIRPGFDSRIALESTKIDSDDSMRLLTPGQRGCRFSDESEDLKLHKFYSNANCYLECALLGALEQLNQTCLPWHLPKVDLSMKICDPWQARELNILMKKSSQAQCSQCLPDCSSTSFQSKLTSVAFDKCDYTNIGMTEFCNFNSKLSLMGKARFATQLMYDIYKVQEIPGYFKTGSDLLTFKEGRIVSSRDSMLSLTMTPPILNLVPSYMETLQGSIRVNTKNFNFMANQSAVVDNFYNAFEKDLARLKIVHQKSTALQIERESKMTWIDFLASVGGILGLVLGVGFITMVEIVWITFLSVAIALNFYNRVA